MSLFPANGRTDRDCSGPHFACTALEAQKRNLRKWSRTYRSRINLLSLVKPSTGRFWLSLPSFLKTFRTSTEIQAHRLVQNGQRKESEQQATVAHPQMRSVP